MIRLDLKTTQGLYLLSKIIEFDAIKYKMQSLDHMAQTLSSQLKVL